MAGTAAPSSATLTPINDTKLVKAILTAISDLDQSDLRRLGGWAPLEEISSATLFDGIEGSPSGVFAVGDSTGFEVSGTVYVTLQYGGGRDGSWVGDSYPALVRGKFHDKRIEIESVTVDNSSFYE
ncbi:hypothetical protein G5B46_23460 [Caulobacter sp. 602-2]|uniref:Predicted pPIWI-associating nuclease group 2 domain-containing protein n=1 Tax=Caulobacter sp. 602-2 TaxID=2710887 RepID=A0A6G4R3W7_9CAUL|nr:hypothetical protein [Caulobacter sp. 602-2]NGM52580.1 hypothetical protein [Caulobacter sp. 602-2]